MSSKSGNPKSEDQTHWYLWVMIASVLGVTMAHIATMLNTDSLAFYAAWVSLGLWAIGVTGGLNAERKQDR